MELNEDIRETAIRELREETGLIATKLELIDVLSGKDYYFKYPNGDKLCNVIVLFKVINYSGTLKISDDESKDLKFFSLDSLPIMESRAKKIIDYFKSEYDEKYTYRIASKQDLEYLWNKNIAEHKNKAQWTAWKKQFLDDNKNGNALTFAIFDNNVPIGEGTLLFSPDCNAIKGRKALADNSKTANINALRIQKEYEGRGLISKLVKEMERYALDNGYSYLTIVV